MLTIAFSLVILVLAAFPALLFMRNLPQFHRAAATNKPESGTPSGISVLIPARNEEASIQQSLQCLSASAFQPLEILVLDDASTDRTAEIVSQFASQDARVRLLQSPVLPEGWNGKQHACWQLAQAAKFDWLLFLDADVRLSADALPRIAAELAKTPRDLLSGFPCQETGTLFEKLLIPLMHVVLLGFLPLDQMRASRKPEFGAGCGQLFIARREAYFAADGHRAIKNSRHDGLKLPRSFRAANLVTDIFDATDIATCRMYTSMQQVVHGLLKNATEGIAQPKLIAIIHCVVTRRSNTATIHARPRDFLGLVHDTNHHLGVSNAFELHSSSARSLSISGSHYLALSSIPSPLPCSLPCSGGQCCAANSVVNPSPGAAGLRLET